jgi:hypothetical protein
MGPRRGRDPKGKKKESHIVIQEQFIHPPYRNKTKDWALVHNAA